MKKCLSILILCTMLATSNFLMSCANNEIEETTTNNDITETKINEKIDMEILDELGEYNFENRIFNIIYSEDQMGSSWPYCSDGLNGEILNDAVYNRELSVEERFNVNITWQNTGGTFTEVSTALRTSVMAGDQNCQLAINHIYAGFTSCISDGILYDFNDLPVINLDKPWWNQSARKNLEIGGTLLAMSGDLIYSPYDAVYFNKVIMDEHQISYPYEKVIEGTWTWDYLAQITKNVTQDVDGDNEYTEKDRYGFVIDENLSSMTRLIHSNGLTIATKDENGYPTLDNLMSDKLQTIVDNYYSFVWEDNRCYFAGVTGKSGCVEMFANGQAMMMHTQTHKMPLLRDVAFDFGIVPLPKYDKQQEGYYTLASSQMLLLPADMDNPEFIGVIIEALGFYSYKLVVPELYEVVYQNKYLRDEESEKMFELIRSSLVYDAMWNYGNGGDISYLIARTVGNKNTDVSSFIAANITKAQNELDKVYNDIILNYN